MLHGLVALLGYKVGPVNACAAAALRTIAGIALAEHMYPTGSNRPDPRLGSLGPVCPAITSASAGYAPWQVPSSS